MGLYNPIARLLYSNVGDQTLTTSFAAAGTFHSNPNSLIDLRDVADVWLSVFSNSAAGGATPTLDVYLDVQDSAGNWFTQVVHATPQLTTAAGTASASAGLHMSGTGALVLPAWGRIAVVVGGTTPSYPSVTINVWGR